MTVHDPNLHPAAGPDAAGDPTEAGGILTIDLAAIEANWIKLSGMTVPVECAAVVKADAYGCGLEPVTRVLYRAGCRTFFVADVVEGRRVRAIAADAVIYVLNGLMPGSAAAFAHDYLRPVINSTTELAEWDAFVAINNWRGGAARRHRHEPARHHG
jgi:alanine racemase